MNEDQLFHGIGAFIRTQRELANLSLRQLSALANVSNPYLSQIERGIHKPSAEVLKNIANALQLQAETFFAQAGLLDKDMAADAAGKVESSIKLDPNLSSDQKETLMRIYRGFVAPR